MGVGRIRALERGKTKTGKEFYAFKMYMEVPSGKFIETLLKYCIMWPFPGDRRVGHLEEGAMVAMTATFEAYKVFKNEKTFVNERLRVSNIMQVMNTNKNILQEEKVKEVEVADEVEGYRLDNSGVPF